MLRGSSGTFGQSSCMRCRPAKAASTAGECPCVSGACSRFPQELARARGRREPNADVGIIVARARSPSPALSSLDLPRHHPCMCAAWSAKLRSPATARTHILARAGRYSPCSQYALARHCSPSPSIVLHAPSPLHYQTSKAAESIDR